MVTTPTSPNVFVSDEKKRKITAERAKANHLLRQLQMRLQYARLKVDHGWQRQNLNEVENLYFTHSTIRGSVVARPQSSTPTLQPVLPVQGHTIRDVSPAKTMPEKTSSSSLSFSYKNGGLNRRNSTGEDDSAFPTVPALVNGSPSALQPSPELIDTSSGPSVSNTHSFSNLPSLSSLPIITPQPQFLPANSRVPQPPISHNVPSSSSFSHPYTVSLKSTATASLTQNPTPPPTSLAPSASLPSPAPSPDMSNASLPPSTTAAAAVPVVTLVRGPAKSKVAATTDPDDPYGFKTAGSSLTYDSFWAATSSSKAGAAARKVAAGS